MKIKTLLLMALVLLTIGCVREQSIEKLGREKMEQIEKEGFPHIQKMIVNNLKDPESYEPISTDMSIVTSDMIIYDSDAFIALRDLERSIRDFKETYGNDSTSQEARNELHAMQAMKDVVFDRANTRLMNIITAALIAIGVICVAAGFIWFGAYFLTIISLFMALIVLCVKVVFAKAIEMKEEMDLTI